MTHSTSTPEDSGAPDYYAILSLSQDATSAEVKAAYHRVLLASHPDKQALGPLVDGIDIGLLKDAFNTLHNPQLRKIYDASRTSDDKKLGPRPAQVISLEEFDEESDTTWNYPCRCGGTYVVTEEMLDSGEHLVGCASCSEVVWVGYELVEEAENVEAQ
ncbi:hypothetical protein L227DRAFT_494366 [Lentinus tigrinus ALCF2SS1-6]|uniref:Diphthamide biosynthesis protein 4 n=1 Tax=Lentinus tigrinus ALCF2SS1-6 TaxID=1328759 RepID=A0A5C2SNF2_9APHY|nr:hypothetical protein L227DRAFT_494366 [Lentinus tigrinus ALCF2SS1-6]